MRYLLKDGSITTDLPLYVKDRLELELSLYENEIPLSDVGSLSDIHRASKSEVEDHFRDVISEVISKIITEVGDVSLSLDSVQYINRLVRIRLLLDYEEVEFELINETNEE